MKIYTRKGDAGKTGLFDGTSVRKDDPRVDAYGDIDELNSVIGAACAFVQDRAVHDFLEAVQTQLFALGAQLADPKYDPESRKEKTRIDEKQVAAMEGEMDRYEAELPALKGFILPCGTKSGSMLHLARTVCRRAERKIVALPGVRPIVLKYVNRLSDLLFVLARMENKRGGEKQVDW